jgi:hypothetical protein
VRVQVVRTASNRLVVFTLRAGVVLAPFQKLSEVEVSGHDIRFNSNRLAVLAHSALEIFVDHLQADGEVEARRIVLRVGLYGPLRMVQQ